MGCGPLRAHVSLEREWFVKLVYVQIVFFFFLNDPPPTESSPFPLPDALPIPREPVRGRGAPARRFPAVPALRAARRRLGRPPAAAPDPRRRRPRPRRRARVDPDPLRVRPEIGRAHV